MVKRRPLGESCKRSFACLRQQAASSDSSTTSRGPFGRFQNLRRILQGRSPESHCSLSFRIHLPSHIAIRIICYHIFLQLKLPARNALQTLDIPKSSLIQQSPLLRLICGNLFSSQKSLSSSATAHNSRQEIAGAQLSS